MVFDRGQIGVSSWVNESRLIKVVGGRSSIHNSIKNSMRNWVNASQPS